jgi:hypothetical protein
LRNQDTSLGSQRLTATNQRFKVIGLLCQKSTLQTESDHRENWDESLEALLRERFLVDA